MYCTTRRVEFRDTDAAGIMHFSAFFTMMESAEHEMLRSVGLSVMPQKQSHAAGIPGTEEEKTCRGKTESGLDVTWPRVSASCDYLSAVRFEDQLTINIQVVRIGNSSVTYQFNFTCDHKPIANGKITVACCRLGPDGLSKAVVPDSIRVQLSKFSPQ